MYKYLYNSNGFHQYVIFCVILNTSLLILLQWWYNGCHYRSFCHKSSSLSANNITWWMINYSNNIITHNYCFYLTKVNKIFTYYSWEYIKNFCSAYWGVSKSRYISWQIHFWKPNNAICEFGDNISCCNGYCQHVVATL